MEEDKKLDLSKVNSLGVNFNEEELEYFEPEILLYDTLDTVEDAKEGK